MKRISLGFVLIALAGCQASPINGIADSATISNHLFYNGQYPKATHKYKVTAYGDVRMPEFAHYQAIDPGEYEFEYGCAAEPAGNYFTSTSTHTVEAGKCYIPQLMSQSVLHGKNCKQDRINDLTSVYRQQGNCGVGGYQTYSVSRCSITLKQFPCPALNKLGIGVRPAEIQEALSAID